MNAHDKRYKSNALSIIVRTILATLALVLVFALPAVAADETPEGDYIVVDGTTYTITNAKSLIDADLALLRWRAKGDDSTVYGSLNGELVSGFEEVYAEIYNMLLNLYNDKSDTSVLYYDINQANTSSGSSYITTTCPTLSTSSSTVLWKITGDVTLAAAKPIANVGKIIIIAEDSATIQLSQAASQFTVSGTATLAIQGRSADKNIKVTSTSSTKSRNAFQINGGSLYLQYSDLNEFKYGTSSLSVIRFPSGSAARYLYMSDSYLRNISASNSPGIFCTAYSSTTNAAVNNSKLYIYKSEFSNCLVSDGESDTVGGPAIRSYAADVCKLQVKDCTFEDNRTGSKTAAQSGTGTGGGAIYWKSVSGKSTLINCTFKNNHTSVTGGAILNMGTMEIIGCRFENNTSLGNGGAISVETPYTNDVYSSITDVNALSGTVTLDSDTKLIGNKASGDGGAIYFNAVNGQIGNPTKEGGRTIEQYQMKLEVNGAEISGNTAGANGGAVSIYLNYAAYEYTTGVEINEGSIVLGNTAAENGGAIWITSASDCDCKENNGVIMNGGTLEGNTASSGGAIYIETGKADVEMNYYIGGGTISTNNATSSGGAAYIQGGSVIMSDGTITNCSAEENGGTVYISDGSFSISGGSISQSSAEQNGGAIYLYDGNATISGGSITDCHATENGGAIYMGGGTLSMSDGEISSCEAVNGGAAYLKLGTMSVSGGSINNNEASEDGGALYLGGGELTVSEGEISYNSAINGGGAFVANGNATVKGGVIYKNTASGNGGGIDISNGNFIMSGGSIDSNEATSGDGGAIYVSSSQDNSVITVSSGSIINNFAGGNGGALGVHGQDGITFTITIGRNTNHEGFENAHECENSDATEPCPIIKANEAVTSGGGIYLSGSYEAKMNIYCLIEDGNKAEDGVSRSNFMEVQGGTLTISTLSDEGTGDYGNVVINSTVHVNGGKVTLEGKGDSPHFNGSVYVDVNEAEGSTFFDDRTERSSYTVQYFENFGEGADRSGEYILIDVPAGTTHFVQANSYYNVGFEFKHWVLMERDENNKLQETSETYDPGKDVTVNKNLIFHAKWFAVGYTVIFKPGTEEFENTMEPQTFLYTDTTKALTLNNFVYPGFAFVKWIDEDTGDVYTNGQILTAPIRTEDGAVVNLVAEWTTCYHTDMGSYHISNPSDNIMLRECPCGGYNETATLLGGINTVYDESKVHTASVSYYTYSVNSHYPSDKWSFEIKYSGNNWENVPFDEENLVPQNAGKYKASIEFNRYTAFVEIVIEKAEQAAPGIPQYEAQTLDGKTTLIITETNFIPGLEYLFTWYDDIWGVYMYDGWNKWTDEANPPSCPLDRIYTNYYVDVRYAETENYKASPAVRGETVIMHTGGVIFRITCAAASGITQMTDEDSSAESGVTVNLIPLDIDLYYIYNVTYEMYSDYTGYVLPEISYDDISGEHWIARITKIQNAPDDVESVTIYITFSGAELIPTVEASTDKGENFDGALGGLGDDVYVSRDSAYTAEFKIGNYKHYGAASLVFSHSLPIGTTVIMIDENDGSYYSYEISSEAASIPISSNFVRMGSNEAYPSFPPESERLNFRFIIDFSRCESYIAAPELTASFYAVPIYPSDDVKTVPNLPTGVGAIATVKLVNAPTFDLYVSLDSTDSLTKNLTCKYAESQNTAAGISRWEARRGILVITPSDLSALPPDTRLRVKITNKTNTYYLSDGKYIIPLTSVGTDDVSITLVSDMIPNENADFVFSVKMFSSYTRATTSPDEEIANLLPITLTYKVSEVPEPELHAELDGALPEYKDGAISKAELKVLLKGLPEGYSVKAVVYVKDKASGRYIAAQTTDLTSYFENSETEISATLEFNSLLDRMSAEIGSLSIMARVEIIDQNEKTLTYVPVYFILKDTRQ